MLEQQSLLLLPWHLGGAEIVEPGPSAPLGFVRRQQPSGPMAWLCWWRRCVWAVHEHEDEPLLLTLYASLGSWRVCDADGQFVGRIRGGRLFDAFGKSLAQRHSGPDGRVSYRNRDQDELAVTACQAEGVCLTFAPEAENPFVRMVLLAAALVHNQNVLDSSSGAGSPRSPARPSLPTGSN